MCSKVTKARLKGAAADSEVFFIKQIHKEMIWTADNEKPGLELAGNYPGVVKCHKIFDDREEKGEDGVCTFVLQMVDGGYMEGYLQKLHKTGEYLGLEQWFKWADKMMETVLFLHEKCFMIHSDLHMKNWLLTPELDVISCDFGCCKIIGPGGKVPAGTKVFCADIHSGPEGVMEKGKSFFESNTQFDISYANDTHQLAFCLKCMLAQGEWLIGRPVPNTYGKAIVEYLDWMMNPDQYQRPTIRAARERLAEVKKAWQETAEKAYTPDIPSLFASEVSPQHAKLHEFRQTLQNFFTENKTAEEKEFHDHLTEMRVDGKPVLVDRDGYQGTYIGQLNKMGQMNGRGVLLQKRSLYEGFWCKG